MTSLPTLDHTPADGAVTRRDFVCAAGAILAAALAACGGDAPTEGDTSGGGSPPAGSGVTFANGVLTVPVAAVAGLGAAGGFFITNRGANDVRDANRRPADVIVINVDGDRYRAFSSECTHAACTVATYANGRIGCPCHGSEFDSTGRNVAGPAPRPLTEYATTLDAAARTVVVRKA